MSDIATALTGSVASDGQTPITGELQFHTDGFVYVVDTDTGIRRSAPGTQIVQANGTDVVTWSPTGESVTGDLDVSGTVAAAAMTIGGASVFPTPIGAVVIWTGRTAPSKWLMPGTYTRATYAALWTYASAEITAGNTFFGVGNGSTTFTIGDPAGRAIIGVDAASSILSGVTHVGDTTGAATITLDTTQIPSHTHTASVTDAGHTHSLPNVWNNGVSGPTAAVNQFGGGNINGATATGSNTTGITVSNSSTGGGGSHANVQPSMAFNFIVYAGV